MTEKAAKIQDMLKTHNDTTALNDISSSVHNTTSNSQIEELLRVVETKIQVVVQETKKIIERMTS